MSKQKKIFSNILLAFVVIVSVKTDAAAQSKDTASVIPVSFDIHKQYEPISRLVYGQFIELLFNYFEGGLWAEMLGDRKFFYPVNSKDELVPINTRNYLGRWKPVGADRYVVMDKGKAYTGKHAPKIILDSIDARGVQQTGLQVQKNKSYTGYIILAGTPGTKVNLSLKWGGGDKEKQIIELSQCTTAYQKIPFQFRAGADTKNAIFEITAKGKGTYHIGAVSLMPADNVKGFRADILALLKEMNMGIIRWGGNASSGYDWRNGVGNRDKRPPVYDYAWNAMESNDVGTDEYITLCSLLGVEPYIGVNAGLGDAYSAAQWLEYVNGSSVTPMGKWRASHGHAEPYRVKWWGIGNEMYGEWQLGYMAIDDYVIKHKLFAEAMRKVDSSIVIVASGASPYETGSTSVYTKYPAPFKTPYAYGSDKDWSGNLLAYDADYMTYIAEHLYPVGDSAYDVNLQKFVYANDSLIDKVRRLPNRIKGVTEAYAEYTKRIPGVKEKNITIALDEWRLKDGWGLSDALATAEAFQEIYRHTDIFKMTAYTSTTAPSCLLYDGTHAALQPMGLVLKLFSDHYGTIPVAVAGNIPQHEVKGTAGVDKPFVSSGSATYPLDVTASLSTDRKKMIIAVVNPTYRVQQLQLKTINVFSNAAIKHWSIGGTDPKDYNPLGEPAHISIIEDTVKLTDGGIGIQPLSVNLYEVILKQE